MSANMAIAQQLHHSASSRAVHAETTGSWFAAALNWIVEAATQPLSPEFDVGSAPRSPGFPAFYC